VMQRIKQDIDAQKLNRQQTLARRQHAYKLVNEQLNRMQEMTQNDFKRQQLALTQQKLNAEINATNQERLEAAKASVLKNTLVDKISSKEGLTPQELNAIAISDPKLNITERAIALPFSKKIRVGTNKASIDKLAEFQNDVVPAIQGAKRLLRLSKEGSRLNLEDRAKVSSDLKALVGQLRIPFTGPGVLTDREYDRLLDTIGDPNKLFALPFVERTKIETVINKLSSDLVQRYKNAGIQARDVELLGPREALIRAQMKRSKDLSRDQLETAIDNQVKKGALPEEYAE